MIYDLTLSRILGLLFYKIVLFGTVDPVQVRGGARGREFTGHVIREPCRQKFEKLNVHCTIFDSQYVRKKSQNIHKFHSSL